MTYQDIDIRNQHIAENLFLYIIGPTTYWTDARKDYGIMSSSRQILFYFFLPILPFLSLLIDFFSLQQYLWISLQLLNILCTFVTDWAYVALFVVHPFYVVSQVFHPGIAFLALITWNINGSCVIYIKLFMYTRIRMQ